MTNTPFETNFTVDDDLALAQENVKAKALEASKALEKVDPELHQFWNLVLAERRLYVVEQNTNDNLRLIFFNKH